MIKLDSAPAATLTVRQLDGLTILSAGHTSPRRRVLYVNSYGMAPAWRSIQQGLYPGHHLWGCLELVQMGYEVAMPEEPHRATRFFNYRRQDFRLLRSVNNWLGRDGIVYSGHTILFWIPLLHQLQLRRGPIVSMFYARAENLPFSNSYRGLLALTPAGKSRAQSLAPRARVAQLGWGVDLSFFPELDYQPEWFLSCGKTRRDFATLAAAAAAAPAAAIHVINSQLPADIRWPANVKRFTDRQLDWQTVSYQELFHNHYSGCAAALIVLQADPGERFAVGTTQILEAMALARPVIVTRTGALPGEIDVEQAGCGLFVPPNDPAALAAAIQYIAADPARAAAMGQAGRRLCEARYNIGRYARDLHEFFESL